VTQAMLTVTANNASSTYGGAIPALTYTVTGFVNSDNQSILSGTPALSTTGTSHSAAGSYPITISQGTLRANANYGFAFVNGTLTINQAVLRVTPNNATMTYGGTVPTFTASYSGFVNGDTQSVLSGSPSLTTVANSGSPVGTYPITASQGTLSAANYTFTFGSATLTVNKAVLRVSANNQTMTYGGTFPSLTVTYIGFVNGDGPNVLSGSPSVTTTATQRSPVGHYTITAAIGTLSAGNYTFTFNTATLIINPAVLAVTATSFTRAYGQNNPTLTYTITGFVNGDTRSVVTGSPALTTLATPGSHPGTYTITIARGTLVAANYTFTFVNGSIIVTKATTAVSWTPLYHLLLHGMPLGSGFINAKVVPTIGGTMVYTTVVNGVRTTVTVNTVLPSGTYTVTATFTPTDGTDYSGSTAQQSITIM
jgi:hypothetical protein